MNYYYQQQMIPAYYYQRNPYAYHPNYVWPQNHEQNQPQLRTLPSTDNKGNICAYVSDQPVQFHQVNITHWPSEDYKEPYPKGFLHTDLSK